MRFRQIRRAVALGLALILCVLSFWLTRLRGPMTLERRALWLQRACRMILASLGIRATIEGKPATSGLVVSNHLSYLDILILSSAMPCFFVAKMEIASWPYFGRTAKMGGTIFLDRSSMASAQRVADIMTERFRTGIPVLLFPEGTSTDGAEVLRFHSRLIDPATSTATPITTAALRYVIADGTPERELCWFGDALFFPHMVRALAVRGFSAHVRFGEARVYADRRTAADQTHNEVVAMRAELGAKAQEASSQ
jgi:1-acyl-sn-glycerol-3-phosphate acyltransferase